jgi:hypothetical protein
MFWLDMMFSVARDNADSATIQSRPDAIAGPVEVVLGEAQEPPNPLVVTGCF